jgi:hypothetical protein
MVTPTTAEATPELPGTLGMVRTVSATPQVVWRSWSDTGGGPGVPLIHGDHPVSPPVASADQPRRMLDKMSAHRTRYGDVRGLSAAVASVSPGEGSASGDTRASATGRSALMSL